MTFTFSLAEVVTFITIITAIAGAVVWMFSTFITRKEAERLEAAVDRIVTSLKENFDEKIKGVHARLDAISRKKLRKVG